MATKLKASLGTTATGTPSSTTFLRGDNTWGEAGATAGQVIQVVQTTKTDTFSTTSSTLVDVTGLSVSITPSSTSNKILVLAQISGGGTWLGGKLLRGSTSIFEATGSVGSRTKVTFGLQHVASKVLNVPIIYLDSPSTTSSTTYKIQVLSGDGSGCAINAVGDDSTNDVYIFRATSSITVMEIKG